MDQILIAGSLYRDTTINLRFETLEASDPFRVDALASKAETVVTRTTTTKMHYASAQQPTHQTPSDCPTRIDDLLEGGMVFAPSQDSRRALLELGWGAKRTADIGRCSSP